MRKVIWWACKARRQLAEAYARQDPTFRTTLAYTLLTAQAALDALRTQGYEEDQLPSPSTMAVVRNRLGLRLRKVINAKTQKKIAETDDLGLKEKYIPCGIVEEDRGQLHITFGSAYKTSDFIVVTLVALWVALDESEQMAMTQLQIDMDNGPESSGKRTQFMQRNAKFDLARGIRESTSTSQTKVVNTSADSG